MFQKENSYLDDYVNKCILNGKNNLNYNLIKELKEFEKKIDILKLNNQIKLNDLIYSKEFLEVVFRIQISSKIINKQLILKIFAKKISDEKYFDICLNKNFFELIDNIIIELSADNIITINNSKFKIFDENNGLAINLPYVSHKIKINFEFINIKQLYFLSPNLKKFMNINISSRIDVLNFFNKYILDNNLISIKDKSILNCDKKLKEIFKLDFIPLNELGIFINNNLKKINELYKIQININKNILKKWQNNIFDIRKDILIKKELKDINIDKKIKKIELKEKDIENKIQKYKIYSKVLNDFKKEKNVNKTLEYQKNLLNIVRNNEQIYLDKRNLESEIFGKKLINDFQEYWKKDLLN